MRNFSEFILSDFTNRCTSTLEENGDNATKVKKYDEALATYSIALSLSPSPPNSTLIKWVKVMLVCSSVDEALDSATKVCFS